MLAKEDMRPIENLRRDTVIPNNNSLWSPSHTGLNILAHCDMVVQEFQEVITLFLLEADNVPCELWVDVQRLLSCCWVSAHNGMD